MSLSLRAFIEKRSPHLVQVAEEFLQQHKIYLPAGKPVVSGTQLRNLLAAAQSGSPVAVLRNFLHYQMGRDQRSRAWADSASGHALIGLLEKEVAKPVADQVGAATTEDEARFRLEAELASQLLGFLHREYTYQAAVASGKVKAPPAKEGQP